MDLSEFIIFSILILATGERVEKVEHLPLGTTFARCVQIAEERKQASIRAGDRAAAIACAQKEQPSK
jgi:hypothetical protein